MESELKFWLKRLEQTPNDDKVLTALAFYYLENPDGDKDIEYFEKTAEKFSLIKSAGSDFHGANRKGVDIGDNYAQEEIFYIWEELFRQINN